MARTISIPKGMSAEDVAQVLNAYLLGSAACLNADKKMGPVAMMRSDRWQLDNSNDYWLQIIDWQSVEIQCRHDRQKPIVKAMVDLFEARYGDFTNDDG